MESYSVISDDILVKADNLVADSSNHSVSSGEKGGDSQQQQPLCASCDRCRSRKTKCDGNRPCSNCVVKYLKKNKLERYVRSTQIGLLDF
jgi:Fungal Zn(2)-Cys(6) binuclear cluster domain